MRRAIIRAWQSQPAIEFEEVAQPVPGPDDILVAVHTAAINFGDTLVVTGRYQVRPDLPFVPGMEASGTVVAVGEAISGFAPGDRIAATGFIGDPRRDRRGLGALAEYISIPAANAVRVPAGVALEQAALFRSNMETSYYALHRGRLQPGETLLVMGAGGGTGSAAVQLGKMIGARVIASASSEEKRAIAREAGADDVIDSRAEHWREQVDALTGERGVDVVYDPVGGSQTERAFRALGWNGRLLVVGFAAGAIPALPANLPLLKGAAMIGANLLLGQKHEPDEIERQRSRLMRLFGEGKLRVPPIARRYPLSQAGDAYAAVASGEIAGRIVVRIAEE